MAAERLQMAATQHPGGVGRRGHEYSVAGVRQHSRLALPGPRQDALAVALDQAGSVGATGSRLALGRREG
jgi:hypothetical protein